MNLQILSGEDRLGVLPLIPLAITAIPAIFKGVTSVVSSNANAKAASSQAKAAAAQAAQKATSERNTLFLAGGAGVLLLSIVLLNKRPATNYNPYIPYR